MACGPRERSHTILILVIHIRSLLNQQNCILLALVSDGPDQDLAVSGIVEIKPRGDGLKKCAQVGQLRSRRTCSQFIMDLFDRLSSKELNQTIMASLERRLERRLTVAVLDVQARIPLQQQFDNVRMSFPCRPRYRCPLAFISHIHCGITLQ
ncbi:hypothetical protein BO99DRAFT_51121 [Aspergillus violaceofuscus CBS 115571]|uniref:Uncharacterized protein n=1 Tax=Aspergillus violaceofuscus (strain CBS 115571) TaxID=1450538 RepID=A0A2V5HH33_ASPV1|nr:hypothetical protein BO99DRAFT_51121 [Aspergillus violaceofuscus CBS 115571]